MSEYLNDKEAEKVELAISCNCDAQKFIGIKSLTMVEHALSCPYNILYRGKKKIGRLIKKK